MATRTRIADLVRPLDPSRLVAHPEPKGWSIGEVLEHLCVSDELYEERLQAVMRSAPRDAGAPFRDWRPSLLGGFLARTLLNPRRVRAPRTFVPGATPRNGVVEAFVALEMAFVKRMDDSASLDWNKLRVGSPALPSFMPKLNLGDVFRTHVVHVTRHVAQIERLAGQT